MELTLSLFFPLSLSLAQELKYCYVRSEKDYIFVQYLISISTGYYLKHSLFENVDLAQCFSVNTVCKVNWYRGFDPSLNMNKIHLSVSLSLSLQYIPVYIKSARNFPTYCGQNIKRPIYQDFVAKQRTFLLSTIQKWFYQVFYLSLIHTQIYGVQAVSPPALFRQKQSDFRQQ